MNKRHDVNAHIGASVKSFSVDSVIGRREFLWSGAAALLAHSSVRARSTSSPDEFDRHIQEAMTRTGIPGLAIGLAERGVVRVAGGYGYADVAAKRAVTADTIFHIASLTKTVTATAVMQLIEEGRVQLDEPIGKFLDFPVSNPRYAKVPITIRQLLMHLSSISDQKYYAVDFRQQGADSAMPLEDFLKDYLTPAGRNYEPDSCFSAAPPGRSWGYSNVGYGLQGYLAGRIGNEDMRAQTHRQLFMPLRIEHTHWTIAETPATQRATPYDVVDGKATPVSAVGFPDYSAGMLRSSVLDFTTFLGACANQGSAGGVRILSAHSLAEMFMVKTPPDLPNWLSGQGLGWSTSKLEGVNRISHWGGDPGVFTVSYIDPVTRRAVAIFTNMSATAESKTAVMYIAARLLRGDFPS